MQETAQDRDLSGASAPGEDAQNQPTQNNCSLKTGEEHLISSS